jgi:hypothetical protein
MKDKILLVLARICLRFARWVAAIMLLSRINPLCQLDAASQGRLTYAFLLARREPRARRIFAAMVRREIDRSPRTNRTLACIAWRLEQFDLARLINQRTARLAPASSEAADARTDIAFPAAIREIELTRALAAATCDFAVGDQVTIVPLSGYYADLFALWKRQFDRHKFGRLLVLTLDDRASAILGGDTGCAFVDLSRYFRTDTTGRLVDASRRQLWPFRVAVIRHLLALGFPVVSLDVDAMIVGDLNAMTAGFPRCDIVVQQDYSIPMEVARRFGFILCCGFMAVAPNAGTLRFFDCYLERSILELDDQTALNHLLAEEGLTDFNRQTNYMTFDCLGLKWLCPSTSLVSRTLHQGRVVRHFQQLGESVAEIERAIGATR